MVERKWDGWRCLCFRGLDGRPRLYSRNDQPVEGAGHIEYVLDMFEKAASVPLFLGGEIVVHGTLDARKRSFESRWRKGGRSACSTCSTSRPKRNGGQAARIVRCMNESDGCKSWPSVCATIWNRRGVGVRAARVRIAPMLCRS